MAFDIEHLIKNMNDVKVFPDTPIYFEVPEITPWRKIADKWTGVSERYSLREREHEMGVIQVRDAIRPTASMDDTFEKALLKIQGQEYRSGIEVTTKFNSVPGLRNETRVHLGLPVTVTLFYTEGILANRADFVNGVYRDVSDVLPNEWFRLVD
jgi:hypothetical protein